MFSRRESEQDQSSAPDPGHRVVQPSASKGSALIGQSIQIEGSVRGEEDLLIQGEVRGDVELKSNQVTIGAEGRIFADVHAKVIRVEGQVDGHLVASEQVVILGTARITGSITSPRISLNDGAKFNGTIDMDPGAERLNTVFAGRKAADVLPELSGGKG